MGWWWLMGWEGECAGGVRMSESLGPFLPVTTLSHSSPLFLAPIRWAEDSVDPALYPRTFVEKCIEAIGWEQGVGLTAGVGCGAMNVRDGEMKVQGGEMEGNLYR